MSLNQLVIGKRPSHCSNSNFEGRWSERRWTSKMDSNCHLGITGHNVETRHKSEYRPKNDNVFTNQQWYINFLQISWSSRANHNCHVGRNTHNLKVKWEHEHLPKNNNAFTKWVTINLYPALNFDAISLKSLMFVNHRTTVYVTVMAGTFQRVTLYSSCDQQWTRVLLNILIPPSLDI